MFFIPIEVYDLSHHLRTSIIIILILNIGIVWYLFQNRHRLFHHHHHRHHGPPHTAIRRQACPDPKSIPTSPDSA